jgi:hypothetical protein
MTPIGTGNSKCGIGCIAGGGSEADFSTSLRFGRNDMFFIL